MGIRRSRTSAPVESPRRSLVASVAGVPLEGRSWDEPQRQKDWQRELYRLLDIVGEYAYAAGWAGSCVSRARLFMAEIGEDGDIADETENETARAIVAKVLGGPHKRREELRLLGFNLFAVGAVYIVAISGRDGGQDEWAAISVAELKRRVGGQYEVDLGRGKRTLEPGKDILQYCWTPHPKKRSEANCPARSSRIVLRELEQLTKYVFSQIDSRLIGAGLLPWPAGTTASENGTVAEDLTSQLLDVAQQSLKGLGTAAAAVPTIVEVPTEALGKIGLVGFASELSKQALELRREAIRRLALGLDMPPEQLLGMGEANHWSGWYIDESAVKIHIEPLLTRICEALQYGFIAPALKAAGLDPDKYQVWFDTSTLTVRPQRLKDTLDLYVAGLVGGHAVLAAGAYLASDAPSEEEDVKRYIRELVLRDPQLFNQASVRTLLGITEEMMPTPPVDPMAAIDPAGEQQQLTDSGTPPPPPPAPDQVPGKHQRGTGTELPATQGKQPRSVTASAAMVEAARRDGAALVLAEATALRALELAGNRLLTHGNRHQFRDTPKHALHTVIPVAPDRIPALVAGAGEHIQELATRHGVGNPASFAAAVAAYTARTLESGQPHSPQRLELMLRLSNVLESV